MAKRENYYIETEYEDGEEYHIVIDANTYDTVGIFYSYRDAEDYIQEL